MIKNFTIKLIIFFLVFLSFGSDDISVGAGEKGKVLQKSHIIKCDHITGQLAGTKMDYIMDMNNMTVTINFIYSDKAIYEMFTKWGSPARKTDTAIWYIKKWNDSVIHVQLAKPDDVKIWDGIGWVNPAIQEITGSEEYQHDKCKVN